MRIDRIAQIGYSEGAARAGYTLVELMVALVLASIASAGIYQGYTSFSASYDVQEQVAEQNQNLRIAMQKMAKDIRMAGYTQASGAGFVTINTNQISFTVFNDGTNAVDTFTYSRNGLALNRVVNAPSADDAIIQNVDALDFVYLDANRNVAATLADVRSVQIALVVRTSNEDYTFTDTDTYVNLQGNTVLAAQNDHFRRRLITAEVECRNMGMGT